MVKANERYGANRSAWYNKSREIQAKQVAKWIDGLGPIPHGDVLEIGPGAREMAPWLGRYGKYHTQDIAQPCDIEIALPHVAGGPWSIVYAAHVLEHLDIPTDAINAGRNVANVLAKGGVFVIQVPDLLRWGADFWDVDMTHNVEFTRRRIRHFADLCGFRIERMTLVTGPIVGPLAYVVSTLWRFTFAKAMLSLVPELAYRIRQAGYTLNGDILAALRKI